MRRSFRNFTSLALLAASAAPAATMLSPPPPPPQKPVTETLYGTTVTDPYRYMENEKDQSVIDWMKAEGRYTRGVFDSVPGRAALFKRIADFSASFDVVEGLQRHGGRTFFEERQPGSDNFDLMVRDPGGAVRKLVDVAAIRAAHGGAPFAINYYAPSNDGSKVAVGISEGGSEDASVHVYDVTTGGEIATPLPLAEFGALSWANDDSRLFVNLLAEPKPGAAPTDKYKNSRAVWWDLKTMPKPLLGIGLNPSVAFTPDEIPAISETPGTPISVALNINGVQNEMALWTAPVADAAKPGVHWRPFVQRSDDVTSITATGEHVFLLSHKDAPTFKVLSLSAGQPISAATTVLPAEPGRLIEAISAASDALYVMTRRGVYSELLRIPLAGGPAQAVPLPVKGSISELYTDPQQPGAVLTTESWAVPPTVLSYDPKTGGFADLKLGKTASGFDPSRFQVSDLKAKAKDGVDVPLSFVSSAGAGHPRPVLLWAYGSYGISQFPTFGIRAISAMQEGIDYAVCHVRGGGELGDAWRLAGKDEKKTNTWRDLIACGETLVANGYTTPKMLFIGGGSAGGITMGRAMEERPDLFAGVIDMVPAANTTRSEFSPNGPPNIPEFGTVTTEKGFRNLLVMDSVQNVKDGTQYPAVLITTGLNDPRVSSWEPGKLAARLRSSGTKAPVLLRVEEAAGHGIGSTKTQNDGLYADVVSFILWRSGDPAWQPAALPNAKVTVVR